MEKLILRGIDKLIKWWNIIKYWNVVEYYEMEMASVLS